MTASMQSRSIADTGADMTDDEAADVDNALASVHIAKKGKPTHQKKTHRGLAVLTPAEALAHARTVVVGAKGDSRKGIISKICKKPAEKRAVGKKAAAVDAVVATPVKPESAMHPAGRLYIIDRSEGHAYIEVSDARDGRRKRWLTVSKADAAKLGASAVTIASSLFEAIVSKSMRKDHSNTFKKRVYNSVVDEGLDIIKAVSKALKA